MLATICSRICSLNLVTRTRSRRGPCLGSSFTSARLLILFPNMHLWGIAFIVSFISRHPRRGQCRSKNFLDTLSIGVLLFLAVTHYFSASLYGVCVCLCLGYFAVDYADDDSWGIANSGCKEKILLNWAQMKVKGSCAQVSFWRCC